MTSEAARLREHLRLVGEVKAASHREGAEAHLNLPPGERLERAVRLCDTMLRLHREAGQGGAAASSGDDERATWERVNQRLARLGASVRDRALP